MPSLQGGTITPGNYQPCTATDIDCYKGTGTTYGVNVVPGTTATAGILGYTAGPGYDDATGLGSLNITSTVNGWNAVTPTFASSTVLVHVNGGCEDCAPNSVALGASVTATGRGGTVAPAGVVEFFLNSTSGTNVGSAGVTPSCTGTGASTSCTGFAYLFTSSLPAGNDTIVAYFEGDGANDAPSTSPAAIYKVYGNPVGNLEEAVDAATGSSTIPSTHTLFVSGWVADPVDGSPMSNVQVLIDGNSVGTPTLGISRPDVASASSNPSYGLSGFDLSYPASSLVAGNHVVTVTATDSGGLTTTLNTVDFTVTAVYAAPVGALEQAIDASNSTTTVAQSDSLFVSGWAGDPLDGSPLANVKVYIDGTLAGPATTGISRPDVVSATGNSAYANSGYDFTYSAASLAAGAHAVTVIAINSHGVSTTYGPLSITVTASYKPPVGVLEQAIDASNDSTTIPQSDTLFVSGWAADPLDGSPLSNVKVYIDGTLAGTPTLGISRPDVASYYSNPSYANSGYSFSESAGSLSIGSHSVTVIAINSHGVSTTFGPLTINVTAAQRAPVGSLEEAVDATTSSTTVSQSDSLFVSGWAADYQDNGPAKSVQILIDGNAAGLATLGISRPDVATYYNNPAWANTGWNFSYAASTLSVGSHSVTATATDSLGLSTTFGPLTINVTP
jgi:hypothetical protein